MISANEINKYLIRLKNGERCIEEFYNAAYGYIRLVVHHYLSDSSLIDDVVTLAFSKVFDNIQKFDERQSGKAWISKIAQNEAYAMNNNERRHRHLSLDEVSESITCTTDDSRRLELLAALESAISKLDETDRTIVELRIYEDMTFSAIADELNMYVGTVHKRYTGSIKQITKEIK